jgi:hypothetical protein
MPGDSWKDHRKFRRPDGDDPQNALARIMRMPTMGCAAGRSANAMPIQRIGDLDIDQDMNFQRQQWRVQRSAWFAGVLILLLALTGIFGGGPLANATATDSDHVIDVDYERIDRRHSPSTLFFDVAPVGTQPTIELWISNSFLGNVELQTIVPEPNGAEAGPDRTLFAFSASDGNEPVRIRFDYEPTSIGLHDMSIGLVDGPSVDIRIVVLP